MDRHDTVRNRSATPDQTTSGLTLPASWRHATFCVKEVKSHAQFYRNDRILEYRFAIGEITTWFDPHLGKPVAPVTTFAWFRVTMRFKVAAMSLLSSIALSACSVVGIRSGTEEPRYTVLQAQGPLEVREYGPRLAAETEVTGSEYSARGDGFRRLARYIFGANSTKGSIAMTAPVSQAGAGQTIAMTAPVGEDQPAPGVWRIRFFMPIQYTEVTLPRPDDPAVKIVTVPAETYGVYRYTGSIDPAATAAADRELRRRLEGSGWGSTGQPVAWFYDPPWTLPFLRRNETAVTVTKALR